MSGPGRTGELTVVLVHGAFTDPSLWSLVATQLREAGVPVLAPINPLQRLASDAKQIGDVTAAITGHVLLAGHGYGGAVIGSVATRFGNTVGLVYVTGYALEAGESIADLTARFPRTPLASALRVADPEGGIDVDPAAFGSVVAADLPAPLRAVMAGAQCSIRCAALTDRARNPVWRRLPSWYVVAADDRCLHPRAQLFMAQRAGSHLSQTAGSHAIAISQPTAVVDTLLTAVGVLRRPCW